MESLKVLIEFSSPSNGCDDPFINTFTVSSKVKTHEEFEADAKKWENLCHAMRDEEPDCDDAYILLWEDLGYTVDMVVPSYTFKM